MGGQWFKKPTRGFTAQFHLRGYSTIKFLPNWMIARLSINLRRSSASLCSFVEHFDGGASSSLARIEVLNFRAKSWSFKDWKWWCIWIFFLSLLLTFFILDLCSPTLSRNFRYVQPGKFKEQTFRLHAQMDVRTCARIIC